MSGLEQILYKKGLLDLAMKGCSDDGNDDDTYIEDCIANLISLYLHVNRLTKVRKNTLDNKVFNNVYSASLSRSNDLSSIVSEVIEHI